MGIDQIIDIIYILLLKYLRADQNMKISFIIKCNGFSENFVWYYYLYIYFYKMFNINLKVYVYIINIVT